MTDHAFLWAREGLAVNDLNAKRGVMYVAHGLKYLEHASSSAKGLKRYNPDIPVICFATRSTLGAVKGFQDMYFDAIILLDQLPRHAEVLSTLQSSQQLASLKIIAIDRSPFHSTLSLDADVCCFGGLEEIFKMIDDCDIVVAPESHSLYFGSEHFFFIDKNTPSGYYNAGVFGFSSSSSAQAFVQSWALCFSDNRLNMKYLVNDQNAMNELIKIFQQDCALRVGILDNFIYNCYDRLLYEVYMSGKLSSIKLMHSGLYKLNDRCNNAVNPLETLEEALLHPSDSSYSYLNRHRFMGGVLDDETAALVRKNVLEKNVGYKQALRHLIKIGSKYDV